MGVAYPCSGVEGKGGVDDGERGTTIHRGITSHAGGRGAIVAQHHRPVLLHPVSGVSVATAVKLTNKHTLV